MSRKLDLSRKVCHVCGYVLKRDIEAEKEWCVHTGCVFHEFKFNIPYDISKGVG